MKDRLNATLSAYNPFSLNQKYYFCGKYTIL